MGAPNIKPQLLAGVFLYVHLASRLEHQFDKIRRPVQSKKYHFVFKLKYLYFTPLKTEPSINTINQ